MPNEKSIMDRLANTVESLAELRVVTAVGDVQIQVTVNEEDKEVVALPEGKTTGLPGIFSEVNLISGDIVTLIDKEFSKNDDPVQKVHDAQVTNGRKIVATNVRTIISLAESATGLVKGMLEKPARRQT